MPNRILRDWTDSETINSLSWQAEVAFTRLIMKVDDFGRYSANPKLLRSHLFPVRDGIRDADITRWLAECQKSGLLRVYEVDQKSYLEIIKFGQKPRAEKSKFPACTIPCEHLLANVQQAHSKCIADAPVSEDVFVSEDVSVICPDSKKENGSVEKEKLECRFMRFWEKYPKKEGKGAAEKIFYRIKPDDDLLNRMLNAIELHKVLKRWERKENYQYIPHPSTWLNGKRWEDDHSGSSVLSRDHLSTPAQGGF